MGKTCLVKTEKAERKTCIFYCGSKEFKNKYHYLCYLSRTLHRIYVGTLRFTIWNIYLFTFGFIEDEILRAKFILSGFFFLLASFIVFSYLNLIWSLIK